MMMDGEAAAHLFESLNEESFLFAAHKEIYRAGLKLFESGNLINIVSMSEGLEMMSKDRIKERTDYLLNLDAMTPSSALIYSLVPRLKDKEICRKIINITNELTREAYNPSMTASDMLEIAENKIFGLSQKVTERSFQDMKSLIPTVLDLMERQFTNKGELIGLATGISRLDILLSGLQKQQLIVLAGDTRAGKSAFALNIAFRNAAKIKKVAYFSFEMSAIELAYRMICSYAELDSYSVRCGKIERNDFENITRAASVLSEYGIYICDSSSMEINQIRSKARKLMAREKIELIVFDYLQQIAPSGKFGSRAEAIALISRSLKSMAKEFDVPILALSQLRRTQYDKPRLHDLKESSGIEQDADVVLFVYRPSLADDTEIKEDPEDAQIIIGKQRSGPADMTINVKFHKGRTEWNDVERYQKAAELF